MSEEYGVASRIPTPDPGNILLSLGSVCHTVVPYDHYTRLRVKALRLLLSRAGIKHVLHVCHRRALGCFGTGPDGAKRFGDDMMPPAIYVEVAADVEDAVWSAMDDDYRRVSAPKPHHVSGDKWFDPSVGFWVAGGTWRKVAENAVAIAERIGAPNERLERVREYAKRHKRSQTHEPT